MFLIGYSPDIIVFAFLFVDTCAFQKNTGIDVSKCNYLLISVTFM